MKLSPASALAVLLPAPRIKQKNLNLPPLEKPYLCWSGARFFAWLLKNGEHELKNKFSTCKVEWDRIKRDCDALSAGQKCDFEKYIKKIGKARVYKTRDHGTEVVKLTDKGEAWAERWTIEYRTYRGHHEDHVIIPLKKDNKK